MWQVDSHFMYEIVDNMDRCSLYLLQRDGRNGGNEMDNETLKAYIQQLRSGQIKEILIEKEEFMDFRALLMEQEDKENFIGRAQKGGKVIYSYH